MLPPEQLEKSAGALPSAARKLDIWILGLVAFLGGAALMGIEIVAARMIGHHMGSTVMVWGGVIGTVMGALALGYWLGGRVADQRPHPWLLAMILALGGAWSFLIPIFLDPLAEWIIGLGLGARLEAILPSVLIFFLPSVMLGMISPFVVRLLTQSVERVGRTAGSLYALSTFGSIVGTLLTTFVMIPSTVLGSRISLLLWAGIILLCSLLLLIIQRKAVPAKVTASVAVLAAAALVFPAMTHLEPELSEAELERKAYLESLPEEEFAKYRYLMPSETVVYEQSEYHDITLIENFKCATGGRSDKVFPEIFRELSLFCKSVEGGATCLECDTGAARLQMMFGPYVETSIFHEMEGKPAEWDFYTEMFHIPLIWNDNPKHVLFVGAGGGIGPRMFLDDYEDIKVDVVEIDPIVVDLAEEYFDMPRDEDEPRLTTYVDDGRAIFYRDLIAAQYDLVLLDAFSSGGQPPFHLMTVEYLTIVKDHLTADGVVASNVISALEGPGSNIFNAQVKAYEAVFDYVYAIPFVRARMAGETFDKQRRRNMLILGTDRRLQGQQEGKQQVASFLSMRMNDVIRMLEDKDSFWLPNDPENVRTAVRMSWSQEAWQATEMYAEAPLLMDEKAPVEVLSSRDVAWGKAHAAPADADD